MFHSGEALVESEVAVGEAFVIDAERCDAAGGDAFGFQNIGRIAASAQADFHDAGIGGDAGEFGECCGDRDFEKAGAEIFACIEHFGEQFGQPIADFQNTQFMLADMATDLEAARALLYLAAAKVTDNAPDKSKFSALAKRLATDSGSKVVNDALQLFGGYGYLKEYPIERFWRDLRVHSILEGTNQVMRMIVGREMLRQ